MATPIESMQVNVGKVCNMRCTQAVAPLISWDGLLYDFDFNQMI